MNGTKANIWTQEQNMVTSAWIVEKMRDADISKTGLEGCSTANITPRTS